ncbi:MAG: hypothetical protein ACPG7F_16685 [Aggregatilineales bacterium]
MKRIAKWLVDEQIIFTSMIGALDVEDFEELDANIISMIESSSSPEVHILSDISMMTTMPNIFQMAKLKYIAHPEVGFFVTQSRHPVERFIGRTVGQIINSRYKFVHDLDQGVLFLTQLYPDLPSVEVLCKRVQIMQNEFMEQESVL